jgi:hypothetical protein
VFVAGFPGGTDRYAMIEDLEFQVRVSNPEELEWSAWAEGLMGRYIDADPAAADALQTTLWGLENGRKYTQGIQDNVSGSTLLRDKAALAARLDAWIAADPARVAKWAAPITRLRELLREDQATWPTDLAVGRLYSATLLDAAPHRGPLGRRAREEARPGSRPRLPGPRPRQRPRGAGGGQRVVVAASRARGHRPRPARPAQPAARASGALRRRPGRRRRRRRRLRRPPLRPHDARLGRRPPRAAVAELQPARGVQRPVRPARGHPGARAQRRRPDPRQGVRRRVAARVPAVRRGRAHDGRRPQLPPTPTARCVSRSARSAATPHATA